MEVFTLPPPLPPLRPLHIPRRRRRGGTTTATTTSTGEIIFVQSFETERERECVGGNEVPTVLPTLIHIKRDEEEEEEQQPPQEK